MGSCAASVTRPNASRYISWPAATRYQEDTFCDCGSLGPCSPGRGGTDLPRRAPVCWRRSQRRAVDYLAAGPKQRDPFVDNAESPGSESKEAESTEPFSGAKASQCTVLS